MYESGAARQAAYRERQRQQAQQHAAALLDLAALDSLTPEQQATLHAAAAYLERPTMTPARSEMLDAVEALYLADLLEQHGQQDGEDYVATVGKLRRMAERLILSS